MANTHCILTYEPRKLLKIKHITKNTAPKTPLLATLCAKNAPNFGGLAQFPAEPPTTKFGSFGFIAGSLTSRPFELVNPSVLQKWS
jgi:hypothetical protein